MSEGRVAGAAVDVAAGMAVNRPDEPDYETITAAELVEYREAENRFRASDAARAVLGEPDVGAVIAWQSVALPGREVPVRVYRPARAEGRVGDARVGDAADGGRGDGDPVGGSALPLVLHVHGGGFVGTAAQCDWTNSYLAAHLPAVVVSVEHRLVDADNPVANAAADGWDVLQHIVRDPARWGVDPERIAVFGESFGGLISALTAIRARDSGLRLTAQVLVNPATDLTETMEDYPSMAEFAFAPSRAQPVLRFLRRLAVPAGTDARAYSPVHAPDLAGLPPTLVVVPTDDAVADHGRRFAARLAASGTSVRMTEYPGAHHAFLTLPGVEPQAAAAQAEIFEFLRAALALGREAAARACRAVKCGGSA